MKTAIYPGSFDPVTYGHLDVITRAARLFDRVVIAVADNSAKNAFFDPEERVRLLKEALRGQTEEGKMEIVHFRGLLVEFARKRGAAAIIRGLRAVTDFEYEFQMALMNRKLCPEIETVFVAAREEYTYLSSRIIKEVARLGGDVTGMVPPAVSAALAGALGASAP